MHFLILLLLLFSPLWGESFGECKDPFEFELKSSDSFHFGRLWEQIKKIETEGKLHAMLKARRLEIKNQKEHWRSKIAEIVQDGPHPFYCELDNILNKGSLTLSKDGCGGAYILSDEFDNPHFIVKPVDEDILCLNNHKNFSSPYHGKAFRVRHDIPLYRSAQTETLCFEIASLLNMGHLTPKTVLAVIKHQDFYDIGDVFPEDKKADLYRAIGQPDREKLCSVQRFLPHQLSLLDLIQSWVDEGKTAGDVLSSLKQEEFENLMLFVWVIHDTDAHVGNFPIIPEKNGSYQIKKIDNGLSFPEKNAHLFNVLYFLPHAKFAPSERLKEKIFNLPLEQMREKIRFYEMETCLQAFDERIEVLQDLIQRDITLAEIDMRLRALELPDGKLIALGPKPPPQLPID